MRNPFRRREAGEQRALSESQLMDIGFSSFGSLMNVTQDNAIKSTAVVACLIVRAETFASLPAHIYRNNSGARSRVPRHPFADFISREWNPMMTSVEGWRWKQITEDIRGNAYVRIERRPGQYRLWPMTNRDIKPKWDGQRLVYEYAGDEINPEDIYPSSDVLHFKGPLVKDAWSGTSLVDQAAVAIGLTIQSERFYERLLTKGNHFPGWLESDTNLTPEDIEALAGNLEALAGVDHAGEMRIFDRGLKYQQNPMSITDTDLTAQQLWYMQEVCRVFRVPPPLVQDWSRSTYTNSAQADMAFAKHTILPICVNTERALDKLFTQRQETDHYVKFELSGLMRGEYLARMQGHQVAIQNGVMNPNEVRALEDMNPYEGGDDFLSPLNMARVDPDTGNVTQGDALSDIRAEKLELIRIRKEQDAQRGRDIEQTRAFAVKVLAPLANAYSALGEDIPLDALMKEALGA